MYINVNGITLFYKQTGHGRPVVLLHGNGEDHTIFDVLIEQLRQNHRVYAIDSRGHGQSQETDSFDYIEMAKDVVGFIKKKHIRKPVLYGFSDGGIIGLIIAILYPNLLFKLITSGANTKPTGLINRFTRQSLNEFEQTHSPMLKMMLEQPDITPKELERIKIPVLVLAGENDLIKRNHTEAIAKHIKNSQIRIIQGQDHDSYIIHNPLLYEIIQPFIDEE